MKKRGISIPFNRLDVQLLPDGKCALPGKTLAAQRARKGGDSVRKGGDKQ